MKISMKGLDKAAVLAALYERARPLGLGRLHYTPEPLTREMADFLLTKVSEVMGDGRERIYFDYLQGRVMKVDLGGDELDAALYDRDNGAGAAESVIAELRKTTEAT